MSKLPRQWKPSEDDIKLIEKYAGMGTSRDNIARLLGMAERTFYEKQIQFPQMAHAIKNGKAKTYTWVVSKPMKLIDNENLGAICFFLKTQAGWKENDPMVQNFTPIQIVTTSGKQITLGQNISAPEAE